MAHFFCKVFLILTNFNDAYRKQKPDMGLAGGYANILLKKDLLILFLDDSD